MTVDCTRSWVASLVRKGRILLTLFKKNLQVLVIEAMWGEKFSRSSRTTPRFLAVGEDATATFSTVIDRSVSGEDAAGRWSSSVLLRFSLRWLVVIQAEISDRQAEIRSETWVSEGGKERKS